MSGEGLLDTAVLSRYLEAHVAGFHGLQALTKFQSGQSNPTYRVDAASGRYVVRAQPPGALLPSAHRVDREFRVMRALAAVGFPVPEVLHLAEAGSPFGRAFYAMRYVEGRIFWDPALPELSADGDRAAVYDAMNATLAALHGIDVAAADLTDFGRPGSYFERQLRRWTEQYRASETQTIADMNALIGWLAEHPPADDGQVALTHGDYRLDNIIFAADGPTIVAVLDWELSTLGHPYADLAYQCMQWRLPHASTFRGLAGLDRKALGLPTEQDYVDAYCRRRGIAAIDGWTGHLAFAFFRLAAICQGVYKRALDGNASNPEKARRYGDAVTLLAGLAVRLAEGRSMP